MLTETYKTDTYTVAIVMSVNSVCMNILHIQTIWQMIEKYFSPTRRQTQLMSKVIQDCTVTWFVTQHVCHIWELTLSAVSLAGIYLTIDKTRQNTATVSRLVRILCHKTENFQCVTCKFCAAFLLILRKFYALFQADFSTLKSSVVLLYDPVYHTSILA